MATLFIIPRTFEIDSSARVESGGLLYFFLTGTTTPTNVYTTEALSVAHSNPVVADAGGVFPAIWLDPAITYKAELRSSAGVSRWIQDPAHSILTQAQIGLLLYPRTPAEVAAGVTPVNYADERFFVRRYGGVFDDATDDSAAWQAAVNVAAAAGGGIVVGDPASSYCASQIVVEFGDITGDVNASERGVILDLAQGRIRTDADIELIRVGSAVAAADAYRGCGVVNGVLRGGGAADTNARALVVRNHSYGVFKNLRMENWGNRPLRIVAFGRGVQYNDFQDIEICFNHAGAWEFDCGSTANGYINDNTFTNVRAYENPQTTGVITHARTFGSTAAIIGNAFYRCSLECNDDAHTLLDLDVGEDYEFYGLRLDGTNSTTAINIASGVNGVRIFGWEVQGVIVDASNRSLLVADFGSGDFPTIRMGSLTSGNASYDIALAVPDSNLELTVRYNGSDGAGLVRFPSETPVLFGPNVSGSATITIDGETKIVNLRTLTDTAIGSGPTLRFDGQFASGGDEGTVDVFQDANGIRVSFSTAGDMLHSTGAISIADGMTAPTAITGRAIIYVDTADGDLKVRFADGVTKTLATDT